MKIAIVKLSALGDIVHAMVVLQFIKKFNQDIEIDWIIEACYKDLLDFNPDINKIHTVNFKKIKQKKSFYLLYKELKILRNFGPYDIVLDMQSLIKSAIISRLIPSKLTLGFDKYSARESGSSIFYNKTFKYGYEKNVIKRNFELIKFALDLPFKFHELDQKEPFLYSDKKNPTLKLSKIKKNIVLIPGASFLSKRYSVENFTKLINLLDANYIIIWGNEEEKILASNIQKFSPRVIISDKLSINSLKSLISQADLVIGPDTGPTHMAWALNVASITLFGPTPGYRNSYLTKINRLIESKSKVNPLRIDKNDFSINDISVHDIFKISEELLGK